MAVPCAYTVHMTNNQLPMNLQDRYEVRDGFIIKKGETDPAIFAAMESIKADMLRDCLLYTSPSPRDNKASRMPSSA